MQGTVLLMFAALAIGSQAVQARIRRAARRVRVHAIRRARKVTESGRAALLEFVTAQENTVSHQGAFRSD